MHEWVETNQFRIWKTVLLLVVLLTVSLFAVNQDFAYLQELLKKYGNLNLIISVAIYALLGATPVPSEPLTLFLTTTYGPLIAICVAAIGNTLAALTEFFIGDRLGNVTDFEKRKAKLPFHLDKLPINSPVFLLLARMLPGFGGKFVSVVSGVYQVPLWTYTWTAMLSNLIGAIGVAYGGYGLLHLLLSLVQ